MIIAAEEKLGYKLPSELIELLKLQNGGYLRKGLKNSPNTMILGIGDISPSISNYFWDQAGLIPFDGDGHWELCLDYRNDKTNPCISYISQMGKDEKIAKSFKDYLSMLELKTYGYHVLESDIIPQLMIPQIEKILNIKFDPLNKWADGIPTQKANFKDAIISIKTNMVPTGFIRKNHERYAELRPTIKGYIKLYDELKENTYLIKV